jgi:hypothetical protein
MLAANETGKLLVIVLVVAFAVVFVSVSGYQGVQALFAWRRRRMGGALGLRVEADAPTVRRGDEFEAVVTIPSTEGLDRVEVGVVCTELYEVQDEDNFSRTFEAVAHETWLPVELVAGAQSVRLAIPQDAPFSYEGSCLSFKWELGGRGRRPHGLDAQANAILAVLP